MAISGQDDRSDTPMAGKLTDDSPEGRGITTISQSTLYLEKQEQLLVTSKWNRGHGGEMRSKGGLVCSCFEN